MSPLSGPNVLPMCNYSKAQFALGNFYDKGIGCIKNTSEAQAWYTKAAENGEEKSFSRLADKDLALKIQKRFKKANSTNPNSTLSAQEKGLCHHVVVELVSKIIISIVS